MKLNFWQWLGIIFIVVGAIAYYIATHNAAAPAPTSHATL